MFHAKDADFFGTGTLGEKGQVVVPAKARTKLGLRPGDDFVFFGHGPIIHLVKADQFNNLLDRMTKHFTSNISSMRAKVAKQSSKKKK
jgi:AbrB family looped-hinge helix DNA binding protein